jgi:hypothetical protein
MSVLTSAKYCGDCRHLYCVVMLWTDRRCVVMLWTGRRGVGCSEIGSRGLTLGGVGLLEIGSHRTTAKASATFSSRDGLASVYPC